MYSSKQTKTSIRSSRVDRKRDLLNETEDTCIDLAVVIVYEFATNKQTVATSAGVCFDQQCFAEWAKKAQRKNITVGSLISKKTGCSSSDPHSHITRHKFSRADLLEHATRVACCCCYEQWKIEMLKTSSIIQRKK